MSDTDMDTQPKSRIRLFIFITIALVVLVGGGMYVMAHWNEESTTDAAIDGRAVSISAKIPGYVKTLNVEDNQLVKTGDVLLEIDPADYEVARDRAQAALEAAEAAASASNSNAESASITAPSTLEAAHAQVRAAEANWQRTNQDLQRMQRLSDAARSQQQLDMAIAAEKSANADLQDAQARYRSAHSAPNTIAAANASSDQLAAQVKQAQADLDQAELNLANTKILAPMDGRITKRGVEKGMYVQPGQQLTVLVGTELWVTANFKETQLRHMHVGQDVDISIDAFSNLKLHGKLNSFQAGTGARFSAFPPENATGNFVKIVQRVPVKITFDQQPDASLALGPGMSVVPTVLTK